LVFITINLYNFILYIQNNFLKTNFKKTITKGFTDGMNPSVFDRSIHRRISRRIYSVGISNTHRLIYRRTESVGIWHTYRWIYRRIYSVGISNTHRKIYRRYISVGQSRYHRRNKNPSVYFKRKTFFLARKFRL